MSPNFIFRFIASFTLLASVGRCIVYVSPSASDSLCGSTTNSSCVTLAQIAAASTTIPTELNLTIIFFPGNHTLNASNLTIVEVPHVSMKSLARDGSFRYVINCHKSSRFQFKSSTHIYISGLTFNGCFETEVHQVSEFIMEDCWLLGTENLSGRGRGRGLVVTKSTLDIRRSYFMSFYGSESRSHKGGAIYCSQSRVYMSDCKFTRNSAYSGAAVHIEENSALTAFNCSFSSHIVCSYEKAHGVYGVVYTNLSSVILSDCSINNNSFCKGNLTTGGALSAFSSNISISGCTFIGNIAFNGGAVYCHRGTQLIISDANFTLNKALHFGGAIHQLDCDVHINRSTFSHNTGGLGGVLYHTAIQSTDKLITERSDFYNNSANRGGVMFFSNGTTNISRCLFSFSEASEQGGSIFLTFANATIISSSFENNKAKSIGGALRAMNDSRVDILKSASFENNSAFYGAAIHLYRAKELTFDGIISIVNNKGSLGILGVINSKTSFSGYISFADNVGSLFAFGSYIFIEGTVNFRRHRVKVQTTNFSNTLERKKVDA